AVESGYTQSTPVLDSPNFYYDASTQSTWRPRNYGRRFLGWLTMRRALTKSANNAAVHIASRVGVGRVVDMARRLGVRSDMRADLSLALGTSEVSLLELTRAYAVFPAGGKPVRTRFIRRVLDRDGKVVFDDAADELAERGFATEVEAVSPQVARVMTDLLHGTVADPGATGRRANSLGRTVAGKTGTTNGNARPEPRMATATPGSSAFRRKSRPGSGSASIDRARSAREKRAVARRSRSGSTTWARLSPIVPSGGSACPKGSCSHASIAAAASSRRPWARRPNGRPTWPGPSLFVRPGASPRRATCDAS
ncbi:MAG: hypothetical protein JRG80_14015, partial [Deltaproteobacteria bacterium]|nr:hypothetical protein [Deltaproteobacteria bacterium]